MSAVLGALSIVVGLLAFAWFRRLTHSPSPPRWLGGGFGGDVAALLVVLALSMGVAGIVERVWEMLEGGADAAGLAVAAGLLLAAILFYRVIARWLSGASAGPLSPT